MSGEIETAKYKIVGLVDKFDEQMNIIGQFPIGSVHELPVEVGTKLVAEGTVEAVGAEEVAEEEAPLEAAPGTTGATGEDEVVEPTGETGEEELEDGDDDDIEEEVL